MRLLVLHPPLAVGRDFVDYPWATDLGAVQLAAVLRERCEVELLDAFALPGAGVRPHGEGHALGVPPARLIEEARRLGTFDAAVLALTPFHRPPPRDPLLGAVCERLAAELPGVPLLLADCHQTGQHHLDAAGEAVLASYPEATAYVKYEAETSVPPLLEALARGEPVARVTAGREADLASLPAPAWDLVDLAARDAFQREVVGRVGRADWPFPLDGRTLPAVTSRGCPYDCVHCSSNPGRPPGTPKLQRRLPPDRLRALLGGLARRHGATRLWILDEMVNASAAHLDALLGEAEALGLPLEFPNGLRADRIDGGLIPRLKGRITTLSVSAESGVQRVVDEVVGKRLDLGAVERVAAACAAAGPPLLVHYIIGLPGETAEEVNATLAHAASLEARHGARPAVQFATPLPGTRLAAATAPVAGDPGPRFQARPSQTSALVPPETLSRFLWAFERRARPGGARKLILNLTYRCNNHCAFCAVGNRPRRDGELAIHLGRLARARAAGATLLDLDGGEPTLHPDLFAIVAEARRLGFERIALTTNGRRCSYPAFARRLAGSGLHALLVSLHGPDAASHGAIVGVPEAFGQTLAGLRALLDCRPPAVEVGVNTTLVRGNVQRLEELAGLLLGLGVRWWNLQLLTPFGRATRDQAPEAAEAADCIRRVLDGWSGRMRIAVVNLPPCELPGYEAFTVPDLGKHERQMAFVGDEEVNLGAWLAARRVRRAACAPCPFASACAGFYELPAAPEPAWTPPASC